MVVSFIIVVPFSRVCVALTPATNATAPIRHSCEGGIHAEQVRRAGLVERAHGISKKASARLVHILLDGFRAQAATDGPPAPRARETEAAVRRNGEQRLGSTDKAAVPRR
jgi:hypothetical protein